MKEFFEAPKMQKSTEESLASRQVELEDVVKLVKLMTPIVQASTSSSSISTDEIERSLTANINELQRFIGKVLADIAIEQNKKTAEAIKQADESPYCGY